ncbi:MAG: rod-binding protein [Deltaproteobacteria bacterium]|nr:rod-binding protein [Candidatus Tharpella aukensis]
MPTGILPAFGPSAGNLATDVSRQQLETEIDAVATGKNRAGREEKLQKACQGFEAIMINVILQEMRKSIPDDGLLPASNASHTWQQLFDNQLAETLASRQEMGVAKLLYQQLQDAEVERK